MEHSMTYEVYKLFPTPLYATTLDLSDDVKIATQQHPMKRLSVDNGHMSTNKYVLETDSFKEVKEQILTHINNYAHEVMLVEKDLNFYITNSWIMQHETGDWGQRHIHQNSLLSGILYIQVDDETGDLVLDIDHNSNPVWSSSVVPQVKGWNDYNSVSYNIKPKNGQLYIFPSKLNHSITENMSDLKRYCIAFNVWVSGEVNNTEEGIDVVRMVKA